MFQKVKIPLGIMLVCVLMSTANVFSQKKGTDIGQEAPNIKMRNPEGKVFQLNDLRGKYVLIDFWASWCGPCRHENPTVVKAYRTFKDSNFENAKGFTVYSVSLDNKLASWQKAIKADQLDWPYHVSDLKGWQNFAARLYGVNSIPTNLLIDGNGIIVAKNLRGQNLIATLERLVQ